MTVTTFEVERADLRRTRYVEREDGEPTHGTIRCDVEAFAFTANNLTYAELGEQAGFWSFFPGADADHGVIPAWGHLRVAASAHPAFCAGQRFYGFVPMASSLMLIPSRVGPDRFVDTGETRWRLPSAYRLYLAARGDPGSRPEAVQALLRPVFITSFLLNDLLLEAQDFGATQIVLTSASCKTAHGLAHLLKLRGVRVVGLTSPGNRPFVERTGVFDTVLPYDDLAACPARPTACIDFTGDSALTAMLGARLGPKLRQLVHVGYTHRGATRRDPALPDDRLPFLAAERLRRRAADWGREGLDARIARAWEIAEPWIASWLVVKRLDGLDAVQDAYREALAGLVAPEEGRMLSLLAAGVEARRIDRVRCTAGAART